jgi:hypothetical protein
MYDFDEVLLFADVEGGRSEVEFVGEHANGPKIHFLVVSRALQEFWGEVEGRTAESTS